MRDFPLTLLKLIGCALLIPLVVGCSEAFFREIRAIRWYYQESFYMGVSAYVFSYIFAFTGQQLYDYGQKIVGNIFLVFGSFGDALTKIFPLFSVLTLILYFILYETRNLSMVTGGGCGFFIGFFLCMHVVLTAKTIKEQDSNPFKADYFILIPIVYLVCLSLMAVLFNFIVGRFSLFDFFRTSWIIALQYYKMCFSHIL